MKHSIPLNPIGVIHTPYSQPEGLPIQSCFAPDTKGSIELYPAFTPGLQDLDGFSHLILIYYFHRSPRTDLVGKPFLENRAHGIFAIRSPHRPNHLGLSIVELLTIRRNTITFGGADMLDQTPLLDIKPYVSHFDTRSGVKNGWLEKHLSQGISSKGEKG